MKVRRPAARKPAGASTPAKLKALPGFGNYPTVGAFLAQGLPVALRVKNPELIRRILKSKYHDWIKKWYLSNPPRANEAAKYSVTLGLKTILKMAPGHSRLFATWRSRKESAPSTRKWGLYK